MNYKSYAGIGARKTPEDVLENMAGIGYCLAELGWVLRSGGAKGADTAFEIGCDEGSGKKEIYYANDATPITMKLAAEIHPRWYVLSNYAKKLQARNCFQILGQDLNRPVQFVICWTPDGADGTNVSTSTRTGGTGQAIRLASKHFVPIVNLFYSNWRDRLANIMQAC